MWMYDLRIQQMMVAREKTRSTEWRMWNARRSSGATSWRRGGGFGEERAGVGPGRGIWRERRDGTDGGKEEAEAQTSPPTRTSKPWRSCLVASPMKVFPPSS